MTKNYNRRKSNIENRNWSDYSEKENAKYMSKQLKDFGYKVPSYMKKGQINQKQIETYANRVLNNIDKMINKEYKNSLSSGEKRQYNKLNKIIVDRGGKRNDRELINNAIKISNILKDYSKHINKIYNNNKTNTELQDINRWLDNGYASPETMLKTVHPALLKSKINKLQSMLETIENLKSKNHLDDYLDRIGAGDKYRKKAMSKFNKLNTGQKIFFNTAIWGEFKIQYSKEDYYDATTLEAKRKYLENIFDTAVKTIL